MVGAFPPPQYLSPHAFVQAVVVVSVVAAGVVLVVAFCLRLLFLLL